MRTEVVNKIEAWLAYTSSLDPVLIYGTNRRTNSVATLSTSLFVTFYTVAALIFLIINLSFRVTDTAQSSDKVVSRETSTGTDSGIPNFIHFTWCMTDTVCFVVNLSDRANSTRISNQIISSFT